METKKIKNKVSSNTKKYEEYLDSDDEFPYEYSEIPSLPVYKNDSRFDKIVFKWVNDPEAYNLRSNVALDTINVEDTIKNLNSNSDNGYQDRFIKTKGVLSKHDLFCLKSIEGCAGDSIFMWLLNFFIYKDVQSSYMFLKSCLVSTKLHNDIYYSIKKTSLSPTSKKYRLQIKC